MVDKAKLIREAQKHLSKGQIDKAIASWETLASAYPEGNTFNFIGDLYLKKGDKKTAVQQFQKAAKKFLDEGFALKGLAIYKKVLNVDPHDTGALIALGELNEEKKITTDAIKYYLAAADVLAKEKKREELLAIYRKILNLAPTNIQLKSKVAEMFSNEGFVKEAAQVHIELGSLHDEDGESEKAMESYMKSVEYVPSNKVALLALSILAEKSGEISKALNYTNIAIERLGEDSELLLRNAHLLMQTDALEDASACIQKAVESDPENSEARKQLADMYLKTGEYDKSWNEYLQALDGLTAADKFDEAADILNNFKDHEPIESRSRLVSVYKQAGNAEFAFNELLSLGELYTEKEMHDEHLGCLKEAAEIQPENVEIQEKIRELGGKPIEEPAEAAAPEQPATEPETWPTEEPVEAAAPEQPATEPEARPDSIPQEVTSEEDKSVPELLTEADIFVKYGMLNDAKTLLEKLRGMEPENADIHRKLKSVYQETGDIEQAVTECIVLSTLYERADDEENQKAFLKEAYELNPGDPRLEGRLEEAGIEATQPGTAPAEGVSVEEHVETASVRKTETPTVDETDFPEMETVDAQELQEPELDSGVMEIFDEFKKGLEGEIDSEDSETHYNLGIAYKEMGLIDDAIKAFQTVSKDPNYFIQTTTMLGICYMEKGLYPLAIESFTGALMKTDSNEETTWSLKYEMALAHERNGNTKEAIQFYTEVYGWNATFRDVGERLNELKKTEEIKDKQKEKKSRVSYL
jgi:tetratricopeptide (TPR) repeat protein